MEEFTVTAHVRSVLARMCKGWSDHALKNGAPMTGVIGLNPDGTETDDAFYGDDFHSIRCARIKDVPVTVNEMIYNCYAKHVAESKKGLSKRPEIEFTQDIVDMVYSSDKDDARRREVCLPFYHPELATGIPPVYVNPKFVKDIVDCTINGSASVENSENGDIRPILFMGHIAARNADNKKVELPVECIVMPIKMRDKK